MVDSILSILEFSVNIIQAFVVIYFSLKLSSIVFLNRNQRNMAVVIGTGIFSALVFILNNFEMYEGLYGMAYVLIVFAFLLVLDRGHIFKKLVISVSAIIITMVSTMVSTIFISTVFNVKIVEIYVNEGVIRICSLFLVVITETYLLYLTAKIFDKTKSGMSRAEKIMVSCLLFVTAIMFVIVREVHIDVSESGADINKLKVVEIGLIAINAFCLVMCVKLANGRRKEMNNELKSNQEENNEKFAEEVKKQYESVQCMQHDMKQSYTILYALFKNERNSEIDTFLNSMNRRLSEIKEYVNTGNPYVDAIMNSKLTYARSHGINCFCTFETVTFEIEWVDFTNLLGDLIDNAIEACEKQKNMVKFIEIRVWQDADYLKITMINSINSQQCKELQASKKSNDVFETTKSDKKRHGIGTKSISEIIQRYNGLSRILIRDAEFERFIMLQSEPNVIPFYEQDVNLEAKLP